MDSGSLSMMLKPSQNIIGMSVVGPDFEKLKRYNIEELRQLAAPSEAPKPKTSVLIVEEE